MKEGLKGPLFYSMMGDSWPANCLACCPCPVMVPLLPGAGPLPWGCLAVKAAKGSTTSINCSCRPEDVRALGPHPRTGCLQVLQLAGNRPAQSASLDQSPRLGLAHVTPTCQGESATG